MTKKQLSLIILVLLMVTYSIALATENKSSTELVDSWHINALKLKDNGKYKEAEALFKMILTLESTNAYAQFDLGNLYLCQNRYDEALDCYDKAVKSGYQLNSKVDYYFNLSLCYIGLGKNEEAISNIKKCLMLNSDYPEAKTLLELVTEAYKGGTKLEISEVSK